MFAVSQAGQLPRVERAKDFLRAFDGLTTLQLDLENMKYHHSLQVISAERFVYSEHAAFDVARDMVSSDERLRTGSRAEIAGRRERGRPVAKRGAEDKPDG
jgi:hypothetical protein